MAENKTKQTNASVDKFINTIKDETIRKDCYKIIKIMKSITKEEPKMWGPSIMGLVLIIINMLAAEKAIAV